MKPLVEIANDPHWCANAVNVLRQVLEAYAATVPTEDLCAVVGLTKVVQIRVNPHYCANDPDSPNHFEEEVDCSLVKQLARQELIRRGLET